MRKKFPKIEKRKRKKKSPNFDSRFNKLKSFRDKISRDLGIDPTLIASRAIMEGLLMIQKILMIHY